MEPLYELDYYLLQLINRQWTNSLFDAIMPWARAKQNWILLYMVMVAYIIYLYRLKSWIPLFLCIAAVAISDQLASSLIKPWVARYRPCQNSLLTVRHVIECGSGYSFISSHAANHFALAFTYGALAFRRWWSKLLLLLWAVWIGYAQIYIAFHYPSDIFAGALLGLSVAALILLAVNNKFVKFETRKHSL